MEYSKNHRQIVEDLMGGKFILPTNKNFIELKEKEKFYEDFFKFSFGHDLIMRQDFAFLVSDETNEMLSRDVCIFFAILCYELDKDGRNFLDLINYSEFEYDQINDYFENSSYLEVVRNNSRLRDVNTRNEFMDTLDRRNIIEKTGPQKFTFTTAHKNFTDFAMELAKSKTAEVE
jgi:hypothetical protein